MTIPPEVVRTRASSTVLVKASSLVNRDLAGMMVGYHCRIVFTVNVPDNGSKVEVATPSERKQDNSRGGGVKGSYSVSS